MNKSCFKNWIYILINLWSSEAITTEDNGTFHAKVNESFFEEPIEPVEPIEQILIDEMNVKPTTTSLNFYSESLTTLGYEIVHFNDTHSEVRNNLEG